MEIPQPHFGHRKTRDVSPDDFVSQGQIAKHLRELEKDLGRAPTMTPPRT